MDLTRLTVPQRVSAGSTLVVVIGAFLPWVSILGISVSGLEGDGVITLVLGLAGAALLVFTSGVLGAEPKKSSKPADIALVVLSALVALIALIDMNGAAAIGLYLTLFAGVAWLVAAIWHLAVAAKVAPPSSA